MNKTLGLQLVVYSALLGVLSFVAYRLNPSQGSLTVVAGLVAAGLCLVGGIRGWLGKGGKTLPVLAMGPITFVLLAQAVMAWSPGGDVASGDRAAAGVWSLLFLLSFAMLLRTAYAGVVFEPQPGRPAGIS